MPLLQSVAVGYAQEASRTRSKMTVKPYGSQHQGRSGPDENSLLRLATNLLLADPNSVHSRGMLATHSSLVFLLQLNIGRAG